MKLTKQIIFALIFGAIVGLFMNLYADNMFPYVNKFVFTPLGTIFLNLIKMLVVPLVFFSIVLGTAGLGDPKKLGRIGLKTISFFLITTSIAISLGIGLAYVLKPGKVGEFDLANAEFSAKQAPSMIDTLLNMIPTNPVQSFVEGNMLQIIVFSIFIGLALSYLGKKANIVYRFVEQGNEIMMFLVNMVMKFAPLGTFGLIAKAIGEQGFDAIQAMGVYMIVIIIALFLHLFVTYGTSIFLFTKQNPFNVFKTLFPAMGVAFSTSSSSATLPVSMNIAQKKLNVPKSISSFVQPLGATINMDGTAIMQGVATIFIAQVVGSDLSMGQLLAVVLTAVLASIGTASVPSAGLIMLAMVLQTVNLPVEGIALIIGIDRLLDMTRTAVNVTGDAVCALIVSETERAREEKRAEKIYNEELYEQKSVSL
ncbi:dicarboxylate/amino acid:cation symporter [Fervidibacillus halotolerans]|uniref:Dicarboxylate/amino acid:cation symporter n=1 Tax=Fervidibacillus halotolerans TaxID=2980027 RepID=A0A9E8S1G2_9BACI|nr:dicarboxylate/amino acid:cation symporter [Fervidibacillus halotolerans]WAA13487.1 dicarboxylate/amino acid:cation symporter [Fervidibacillus halotolerans]